MAVFLLGKSTQLLILEEASEMSRCQQKLEISRFILKVPYLMILICNNLNFPSYMAPSTKCFDRYEYVNVWGKAYLLKVGWHWLFWNECAVWHPQAPSSERETAIYALLLVEWAPMGRGRGLHDLWKVAACHLLALLSHPMHTNQLGKALNEHSTCLRGRAGAKRRKNSRLIGFLGRTADARLSGIFLATTHHLRVHWCVAMTSIRCCFNPDRCEGEQGEAKGSSQEKLSG